MRFIQLTKVLRDVPTAPPSPQADTDDVGENTAPAQVAGEASPDVEPASNPTMINVDSIRCFYPRRRRNPGTRITFTDGGGFAVTESFEAVTALIAAAGSQ